MDDRKKVEDRIKLQESLTYLFESRHLSVSMIARKAHISKSTLHGYINGTVPRGLRSIMLLSDVLRIHPGNLLFGTVAAQNEMPLNKFFEGRYEVIVKSLPPELYGNSYIQIGVDNKKGKV